MVPCLSVSFVLCCVCSPQVLFGFAFLCFPVYSGSFPALCWFWILFTFGLVCASSLTFSYCCFVVVLASRTLLGFFYHRFGIKSVTVLKKLFLVPQMKKVIRAAVRKILQKMSHHPFVTLNRVQASSFLLQLVLYLI